jgi:hypothetical protein
VDETSASEPEALPKVGGGEEIEKEEEEEEEEGSDGGDDECAFLPTTFVPSVA